jgi:hypothetical protein
VFVSGDRTTYQARQATAKNGSNTDKKIRHNNYAMADFLIGKQGL